MVDGLAPCSQYEIFLNMPNKNAAVLDKIHSDDVHILININGHTKVTSYRALGGLVGGLVRNDGEQQRLLLLLQTLLAADRSDRGDQALLPKDCLTPSPISRPS